ncbi:Nucleoporin protein Ndc1-Nup [Phaffia rhodozyma]|uniref:Nucleoporin protein Ndc1-Nup n=1 Tax=Phaffia rhodozyma TaxID=264483 RepID=A0A0F7SHZ0_PHARH|nr:Nucleoporin protein Ndc1-Nup [Phaffia rhodozyma]
MNSGSSITQRSGATQILRNPVSAPKVVKVMGTAGTAYEAMSKKVLGRRLVRVFSLTLGATFLVFSFQLFVTGGFHFTPSFRGAIKNLFSSAAVFVLAVLPTIVIRKTLISYPESTSNSLSTRVRALFSSPSTHATVLVFVACGVIQSLISAMISSGANLGLLASTSRHPFHLNERLIIFLLSNASLGVTYAFRELWMETSLPVWPHDILPIQGLISKSLTSVPSALGFPIIHSFVFSAIYLSVRRSVWRFFLSWFGVFTRPYIANFLRSSHRSIDTGLFVKITVLELATVAGWEIGKAILRVYMVQPMMISQNSASPIKCLLAGLASTSPYFKHFAQFEIAHCAVTSTQRRLDVYSDMSSPTTFWNEVWRAEMVLLGRSYQALLNRGLTASAFSSMYPSGPSNQSTSPDLHGASVIHPQHNNAIFLQPKKHVYDSLASSQTDLPPSPSPAPRRALPSQSSAPSKVPAIFTSGLSEQAPSQSQPAPQRATQSSKSIGDRAVEVLARIWWVVWEGMPRDFKTAAEIRLSPVRRMLVRLKVRGTVRRCLKTRQLDVLAIQALSALTAASLTEDPYGQVQRDIPRTLEAFTSYLSALEIFVEQLQLSSQVSGAWAEEADETMKVIQEEVEPLIDAHREGIRQILETFREHLSAFKFPPKSLE